MINNETIKKARQSNLAEYLISVGVPLVKNGNRYKHKEHDSLVFTKNAYYWNSRQEHGNAIDYLVRHMGMSFNAAVSDLTQFAVHSQTARRTFNMEELSINSDNSKVKKYLNKDRHIGYGVINHLIESRLLFQENRTNNAIFPIYNEDNVVVGAEMQGTVSKRRFKGIKAGSAYGYGFNVKFSDDNTYKYILFFESAIDLMSFIDYKRNHESKDLSRCILVSMSGLKLNIVKNSLKTFGSGLNAVLCVDNDTAGRAFIESVKKADIPFTLRQPKENYKDWNEQLIHTKRNMKPIARLFNGTITSDR